MFLLPTYYIKTTNATRPPVYWHFIVGKHYSKLTLLLNRRFYSPFPHFFSCYILVKETKCFEPECILLETSGVPMSGALELMLRETEHYSWKQSNQCLNELRKISGCLNTPKFSS